MDWFIDRAATAVMDPRTDLLLVLVLWIPMIVLLLVVIAAAVCLIRLMVKSTEPSSPSR